MIKKYRIHGTVAHRFYLTVTVSNDGEIADAIDDAMLGGGYQIDNMVDYAADSMEQFSAAQTLEDEINE